MAQLDPLPFSQGRSTRYSDRLHDFSVTIPRYYKESMSTVTFLAQLDSNSVPIECFPLIYNLNGVKSRINRNLLTVGFL